MHNKVILVSLFLIIIIIIAGIMYIWKKVHINNMYKGYNTKIIYNIISQKHYLSLLVLLK